MPKDAEATKRYREILKPFLNTKPLYGLMTLPAGDGNYSSALREATCEDLSTALQIMEAFPNGNASRINACRHRLEEIMA